jgi:hypothetical protein
MILSAAAGVRFIISTFANDDRVKQLLAEAEHQQDE